MATRYLIGKGELLTYPIEAPKKITGDKAHPYSLAEAKATLIPQIETANQAFARLPATACPDDVAVARVAMHPAYIAKSYFPKHVLQQAGLESLGSQNKRIRPRRQTQRNAPDVVETTELFVAGSRTALRRFAQQAADLAEDTAAGKEFAQIESIAALQADDRIRPPPTPMEGVFEVGLHVPFASSASRVRAQFSRYAAACGFDLNAQYEFEAGRLLFVPVEGSSSRLNELGKFTLMRVVRAMPRLRGTRPIARSASIPVTFDLPVGEPLSRELRVAVLDGGLPHVHVLGPYVRRYFLADEAASDVPLFLDHGLGVTSALLFGPIEPGQRAERPYSFVDHHRVLDSQSDEDDSYELYRTLAHIETVLLSRQYQFINLSLGPNLCVEDDDVHAWTAVIDNILSDGETLLSVAVGNNGERDSEEGLNRIQVPSDSVNAMAVGAVDRADHAWARASYSAVGPGRNPGRRKPDVVAFGGSPKDYFHVVASGARRDLAATFGTSFAAPVALRTAIGVRAILGREIEPLTIKGLVIHGSQPHAVDDALQVGWGRVPTDLNALITCEDGVARIIYQGELRPGKFLRAPLPLPTAALEGNVSLTATFCYASPVDAQEASAYTKAGLTITFRPHVDRRKAKAQHATSVSFYPANEFRTEAELRSDLGKWETVLHASHTFRGSSLKGSVFDVHYNARDAGAPTAGAERIRYALIVTLAAPRQIDLYQQILAANAVLQALEPQVTLPLRT